MENKIKTSEKTKLDSFLDLFLNFIFSKDSRKWLIPIIILGAILRFFLARNISALGDEMVSGPHIYGFLNSGLLIDAPLAVDVLLQ